MSFVFDLPLWIVGLVLVVVMAGLAAVGLLFVRRRVLPRLPDYGGGRSFHQHRGAFRHGVLCADGRDDRDHRLGNL